METLFKTIASVMHSDVKWVIDPERLRPSKSEVFRLLGDNTLITSITNWRPEFNLEQGIKKTVDWITKDNNLRRYKPDIYNR